MEKYVCPTCGGMLRLVQYVEATEYYDIDKDTGEIDMIPSYQGDLEVDSYAVECDDCNATLADGLGTKPSTQVLAEIAAMEVE